jgi:hypothetical protein
MLTSEQAQERLTVYSNPKLRLKLLMRVSSLPNHLAFIGQILIQNGSAWNAIVGNREKSSRIHEEIINKLGELSSKDRRKLLKALLLNMADEAEATWNLFDQLPYQIGFNRRPFRLPGQNATRARAEWLTRLVSVTKNYPEQDVLWFAAWAPYLGYGAPDALGYLFAGCIDQGDDKSQQVYDILISSATGQHEIGAMGRHVVRGLLCSSRPEGWDFIIKLLLAAQREEGLRQVILECIDEANAQAFKSLLQVIIDNSLCRFSATIRAFSVWFGLPFMATSQKTVNDILTLIAKYLESWDECEKAIREGPPQNAYYALWAMAFQDASKALTYGVSLRQSSDPERRFAATHLLAELGLVDSFRELLNALEDDDLRIAARAFTGLTNLNYPAGLLGKYDLFEKLERLLVQVKQQKGNSKPLVWDWLPVSMECKEIAGRLTDCFGDRSPMVLIPYLKDMEPHFRMMVALKIEKLGKKDPQARKVLLDLLRDPSSIVQETVLKVLARFDLAEPDALEIESLLTRRSQGLRRGGIRLLLTLSDKDLLKSIQRLTNQKNEEQRLAALELLQECKRVGRCTKECEKILTELHSRSNLADTEGRFLANIPKEKPENLSIDNALGLMNPDNRTKPEPPPWDRNRAKEIKKVRLATSAAVACLLSLDACISQHQDDPIEIEINGSKKVELLGNIRHGFPLPDPTTPIDKDILRLPLAVNWESWWQARSDSTLKDSDGFELIRALALMQFEKRNWSLNRKALSEIDGILLKSFGVRTSLSLKYISILRPVLEWLIISHPIRNEADFLIDALEASVGVIPPSEINSVKTAWNNEQIRALSPQRLAYLQVAHWQRAFRPETWQEPHQIRLWKIVHWIDQPANGLPKYFSIYDRSLTGSFQDYPFIKDTLVAFQLGAARTEDILELFFRSRAGSVKFPLLYELSSRKPHPLFTQFSKLQELMETCRERILSIEINRGDLPTAATEPSWAIRSVPGARNLFRLLSALGKSDFERGWMRGLNRSAVISHLIRNSYPLPDDSPQGFQQLVHDNKISEGLLLKLAVYAPQWAHFIEEDLQWPKFTEAVWWIYAHTKDRQWTVEKDIRDEWMLRTSENTSLSPDRLMDGAVDVAWFNRIYTSLGPEHWDEIYQAAIYAAGGTGHTRAKLFADAMLGKVSTETLTERIRTKRHQDSVRALGLVPLQNWADQKQEILHRYEVMQEFLRTGKKFGSMRKASEKLATEIGLENLARTAGYPDPQRLEWSMEIESVSDLTQGPVNIRKGDAELVLSIDEVGDPQLSITKNGKELKSIPTALKKDEIISGLITRKQKLAQQASRMRLSLERAMCNGDTFLGSEISALFNHPLMMPMIEQLVFIAPDGMGYPVENGNTLKDHTGRSSRIRPEDELHIAYPIDLLKSGDWNLWQHECFIAERIQPFKQIFRELYVITRAEKEERTVSRRYAGHQVNPRQAVSLFGSRNWIINPEEGVQKTFHDVGLSAHIGFLQGFLTPAEVEGLTIETIFFTKRGEWTPIALEGIPGRIFSEVMRDLDLVVSVAHAGGIDPEASASSIEARNALVHETCALLGLSNVRLSSNYILIEGHFGKYNIHLGSGVVHKQPGEAICIIPIHSQHRGRLFLPFVDNDPKTAEIISKVLLLAHDEQIKDPSILEQII